GGGCFGSGGGGQGGGGGFGGQQGNSEYVGVTLAAPGFRGGFGGGGQGGFQQQAAQPGARPGQRTQGGVGGGVRYLTRETDTAELATIVHDYFAAAGVLLDPPKSIFFNDRLGYLMVRATMQDLDIIEQAVQVLNTLPPELTIETKI